MADKIEIDIHEITSYQGSATPAFLRVFASQTFINASGQTVVGGNIGDRDNWYRQAEVTLSDGVVLVAPFEDDNALDPTVINGIDSGVRYNVYLVDSKGRELAEIFTDIKISDSAAITTWEDLQAYSVTRSMPHRSNYYDTVQIDNLLEGLDLAPDATTLVKGKVLLDTIGADTAVATTNKVFLALQEAKYADSYASFAAAVADIGTTDKTHLIVTQREAVNSNLTIPANIHITTFGNGGFTVANGVTLTIKNGAGLDANPSQRIFECIGTGNVSFTDTYPDVFYPEWWGAVADWNGSAGTDNLIPFNKMMDSMNSRPSLPIGGQVQVATAGTYYFSDTLNIRRGLTITGGSYQFQLPTTQFKFAANKTGLRLHLLSTFDGNVSALSSHGAEVKGIGIMGTKGGNNTVLSTSGLNFTLTGGTFTQVNPIGSADGTIPALPRGSTIRLNDFSYVVDTAIAPANTSVIPIQPPRLWVVPQGNSTIGNLPTVNTFPSNNDWAGQTLLLKTPEGQTLSTHTIVSHTTTLITLTPIASAAVNWNVSDVITITGHGFVTGAPLWVTTTGVLPTGISASTVYYLRRLSADTFSLYDTAPHAFDLTSTTGIVNITATGSGTHALAPVIQGEAEISGVKVMTGQNARLNVYPGIDVRSQIKLTDVTVDGFAGCGIDTNSDRLPTAFSGGEPNTSNSVFERIMTRSNDGSGLLCYGINANNLTIINFNAEQNTGYGMYEDGTVGSNFYGFHLAQNICGGFKLIGAVANNVIIGYCEGSQPSSVVGESSRYLGGTQGASLKNYGSSAGRDLKFMRRPDEYNDVGLFLGLGAPFNTPGAILSFGSGDSDANGNLGNNPQAGEIVLRAQQPASGWYSFQRSQFPGGTFGDDLISFSGSQASQGGSKTAFPNGFRFGVNDSHITKILRGTIAINPNSINANTIATQTFTLTGAATGDNLTLNIPTAGLTAGLLVHQAWVSSANTISITLENTTGSPIEEPSGDWAYLLVR